MTSLFNLIGDPCESMWNSSMVLNGGGFFPPKTTFGSHIGFSFSLSFSKLLKMSRRGPKIVHPDHPLIQLLGPPDPESIPDLRDYNIPLDYGKKTTFS